MGLLDLCCEYHDEHGSPPEAVTTVQLARKVLEYYWPQSIPFRDTGKPLRQYSVKTQQAKTISLIANARANFVEAESSYKFEKLNSRKFNSLLKAIEKKVVEDPLPRLQKVPGLSDNFIYKIWWPVEVSSADFTAGSNQIHFIGNAQHHLVRLRGLLRPMLQREWTQWVSHSTGIQDELGKYLFPESRVPLTKIRSPLLDLQNGNCFYCAKLIRKESAVDHFLPWARTHNDNLGNLVLAHPDCNLSKSDYYASSSHLEKWVERTEDRHSDLQQISEDVLWPFDLKASLGLARGIYLNLPEGVRLWTAKKQFEDYDRERIGQALQIV